MLVFPPKNKFNGKNEQKDEQEYKYYNKENAHAGKPTVQFDVGQFLPLKDGGFAHVVSSKSSSLCRFSLYPCYEMNI